MVARQGFESRLGVLGREGSFQSRLQAALLEQRPYVLAQFANEIGLELLVAAAQGGPDQLHALTQQQSHVELGLASAHQADVHPAAIGGSQGEVETGIVAPHRIEDHVEGREVTQAFQVFATQRTALGPKGFAIGQALGRPHTDPAGIAESLAQLDGGGADAACASMQQHLFARPESGQLEQVEPGGRIDFGQRGGFGQG